MPDSSILRQTGWDGYEWVTELCFGGAQLTGSGLTPPCQLNNLLRHKSSGSLAEIAGDYLLFLSDLPVTPFGFSYCALITLSVALQ